MGVATLSEFELGWIVGLLEGEGSFGVICQGGRYASLRLRVVSTDLDVLERAQVLVGGRINNHARSRRDAGRPRKQAWVLEFGRALSEEIANAIYPFLMERRQGQLRDAALVVGEVLANRRRAKLSTPVEQSVDRGPSA